MQRAISSPKAAPTKGTAKCAQEGNAKSSGFIATLIEAAKRQETLIDALTAAADAGDETALLLAARNLAANRRRDSPIPAKKRDRKPRERTTKEI